MITEVLGKNGLVALLAIQLHSQCRLTPFRRNHPRPLGPRRIVTNMLVVAALQSRHPVLLVVPMKADDAARDGRAI